MDDRVTVVGINPDGWRGLGDVARTALTAADVVLGARRQLGLVAGLVGAELVSWPSPLVPNLGPVMGRHRGRSVCVLASGNPMRAGIGATLVELLGADRVRVVPAPSSVDLACARLGWACDDVDVVSAVGRPLSAVRRSLSEGRRVLVLSAGRTTPGELAALLADSGWGQSPMTVLEQLGGPAERMVEGRAGSWAHPPGDPLNVVAVTCRPDPGVRPFGYTPGLPDAAFDHDGQLTKREVRAVTLACLGPRPGELLWDVGAGAGSIAIEWMRAHQSCRAVAVEACPDRAARVAANGARLGVPGIRVVTGRAPSALRGQDGPDAVFIGGGVSADGVLEFCWEALPVGGRLVANAVTVQAELVVGAGHARLGGSLIRVGVARAAPLGGFLGWDPARDVTIWSVEKT